LKQNRSSNPASFTISVIVPAHEMNADFQSCLQAIGNLSPKPFELIVVADGNDKDVCAAAAAFGAKVIATDSRQGPAAARNLGGFAALGDILYFVDSDVTVCVDAIEQLKTIFSSQKNPDAVIGSYDNDPPKKNFLSQYKNLMHHFVHQQARDNIFTFWTACGAVKKDIFVRLGGFDERYRKPSIEDIELGYRLEENGYSILLSKKLQVTHLKQWSAKSLFVSDVFSRAIPWSRLIHRSGRFHNDLNIKFSARIKIVLLYLLLFQIVFSIFFPPTMIAALVPALILGCADWKLLHFFYHERGALFAARVLTWHWFYYAYSGFAFGISVLERLLGRLPDRAEQVRPSGWNGVL
jgi:GT2 family glycosyltransferase